MSFDFPLILLAVIVFSGMVTVVDFIFCLCKHEPLFEQKKRPMIIEYARSFFPVLLLVFVIRSFLFQPYRVPTGSLEPTVMPGDFILVNQFDYGVRFPVWNKKIFSVNEPKRGDIALLPYPVDHAFTFVKRVIGLPGDHISYIHKTLYINGKKQPKELVSSVTQLSDYGQLVTYQKYQENLMGVKHDIYVRADQPDNNFYNLIVPKNDYFVMGDNRDDSDDSRYWGFVQERDFIGRAMVVLLNWDSQATHWYNTIRWHRIGNAL